MKAEKEVEKVDDNDDEDVSVSGDTETVPPSYFHGFLVFSLWGHISPPGGEKYTSSLLSAITPSSSERKKRMGVHQ